MKSATELALDEAIRAIGYQVALVDNLRARVGILLSATAVATAFLGGAAVDRPATSHWAYPAVAAFVASASLAISVLQPRRFTFVLEPVVILGTDGMEDEERYRWLAGHLSWYFDRNRGVLEGFTKPLEPPDEIASDDGVDVIEPTLRTRYGMTTRFKLASFLVIVEILFWLIALW